MPELVVGLYSCNVKALRVLDNDSRLAVLKLALSITKAHAVIRGIVRNKINGILVAPEYFVSKKVAENADTSALYGDKFINEGDKDDVVKILQNMSLADGRGILFVPGTVAFRKSMIRPTDRAYKTSDGTLKTQTRIEKSAAAFKSVPRVVKDETTTALEGNTGLAFREQRLLFKSLQSGRGMKDDTIQKSYIYKNQAYVLLNGKVEHKYAKKAGYNELVGVDKDSGGYHVFPPGAKCNRKSIGDLDFGFEICFDHAVGVLANASSEPVHENGSQGPMIHVICSDAVRNKDNSPVRVGGYVLHASSNRDYQVIRRRTTTGFVDWSHQEMNNPSEDLGCKYLRTSSILNGQLDLFKIVLE